MRSSEIDLIAESSADLFAPYDPLHVRFPGGELICQEATYAPGVYLIISGIAAESYANPHATGSTRHIGLLGPGQFIGWEILLPRSNDLYLTSAQAVFDVELSFLERAAFRTAVEDPAFSAIVLNAFADRQLRALEHAWRLRARPTERLCSLLLELVARFGASVDGADGTLSLPEAIDRRMLSDLSGISLRQLTKGVSGLPGLTVSEGRFCVCSSRLRQYLEMGATGKTPAIASPS